MYPKEYLNSLHFTGFPAHQLDLKIGVPVMLLRNINTAGGLCNGTRMIVKQLLTKLIEVQIITDHTNNPQMEIHMVNTLEPGQRNKTIEVRVYRKWLSKNTKTLHANNFSCILLDTERNAIQGNMNPEDMEYYDNKMTLNQAYRISNFTCQKTSPFQRTLPNNTTLRFGRHTTFHKISAENFPYHFFNFISYNQLENKLPTTNAEGKTEYPMLTDYIGCIKHVGDPITTRDPNRNTIVRRHIDIENLNGQVIELTLWDALGERFNKPAWAQMPQPVIIAVSSCKVCKKTIPGIRTELQLGSSNATYYYLNPEIPEAENSITEYRQRYKQNPPLQITKQRLTNTELELTRNRHPLQQLLQQSPQNYKFQYVQFTNEATLIAIDTTHPWFYKACDECNRKLHPEEDIYSCDEHGPKSQPLYRYCFRATIDDNTATAILSFFTPNADTMLEYPCAELTKSNPDPFETPTEILELIGQTCVYQFHYSTSTRPGIVEFVFDQILDKKGKTQAITTPEAPHTLVESSQSPRPPKTPAAAKEAKEQKPTTTRRSLYQAQTDPNKKMKTE